MQGVSVQDKLKREYMLTSLSVGAACALMRLEGDSSSAAAAAAVSRAGEAASEALRLLRFALASCTSLSNEQKKEEAKQSLQLSAIIKRALETTVTW